MLCVTSMRPEYCYGFVRWNCRLLDVQSFWTVLKEYFFLVSVWFFFFFFFHLQFSVWVCLFLWNTNSPREKWEFLKCLISVDEYVITEFASIHEVLASSLRMGWCAQCSIFIKQLSLVLSFRRQRARERQQKLLAEFASRQKSFMETAMDVGKLILLYKLFLSLFWS